MDSCVPREVSPMGLCCSDTALRPGDGRPRAFMGSALLLRTDNKQDSCPWVGSPTITKQTSTYL